MLSAAKRAAWRPWMVPNRNTVVGSERTTASRNSRRTSRRRFESSAWKVRPGWEFWRTTSVVYRIQWIHFIIQQSKVLLKLETNVFVISLQQHDMFSIVFWQRPLLTMSFNDFNDVTFLAGIEKESQADWKEANLGLAMQAWHLQEARCVFNVRNKYIHVIPCKQDNSGWNMARHQYHMAFTRHKLRNRGDSERFLFLPRTRDMCPKSVYFVYMSLVWVHPFHPSVFQSLEMFFFFFFDDIDARICARFSFETRNCSTSQGWLIDGPFRDSKCSGSRTTWCRLKRSIRRSCRQSLRRATISRDCSPTGEQGGSSFQGSR